MLSVHAIEGVAEKGPSVNRHLENIYILSICCYLVTAVLDEKTMATSLVPSVVFSMVRYVCLAAVIVKIFLAKDYNFYSKSDIARLVLLTALTVAVSMANESRILLHYEILIVGAYRLDFRKIVKWVFITQVALIVGIIASSVIGVIPSEVYYRKSTGSVRHSLGFSFPTYPAILVYYLSGLYLFYKNNHIKYIEYIAILIINIAMYYLTATRTEIILVVFMVALSAMLSSSIQIHIRKILKIASIALLPCLLSMSVVLSVVYTPSNSTLKTLNGMLSNRLALAHDGLEEYGITLFGQDIEWNTLEDIEQDGQVGKYNIIDNGFINILINYGVVTLCVLIIAFLIIGWKTNDPYLQIVLCAMYIHMMLTPQMMQIIYDVYLLCLAPLLLQGSKNDKSIKKII